MTSKNKLYVGDNLGVLLGMNSQSVDLIYLDPPFNSKRIYRAPIGTPAGKKAAGFHDIWVWNEDIDIRLEGFLEKHPNLFAFIAAAGRIHGLAMKAYLTFMAQRIIEMHRVLKDTGSLYLHCDPTASHYLKILLDEIFGRSHFRNEIVWAYKSGGAGKKYFARKHDIILFYAKTASGTFHLEKEKSYNRDLKPYKFKGVDEYRDEKGWYTLVNTKDIWHIDMVGRTSKERTGYPTQKPLALLDRIIKASSNEGDMVLDPFCGCATTCVAAQHLHRNWIGIDVSDVAVELVSERLSYDSEGKGKQSVLFKDFMASSKPPVRTDIVQTQLTKTEIRQHLFEQQAGKCNGCKETFQLVNLELDHIIPRSKHGGDYLENLQLLCGRCNRIKGDRPMEYLQLRMRTLQQTVQLY